MIIIKNFLFTKNATFSKLYINNEFICYLLQDTYRGHGIKVYGETAIPVGLGKLKIGNSNKFGKVPFIYNVNKTTYRNGGIEFKHLRIHAGNYIKDTHGCPLTGMSYDESTESVSNSRVALNKLMSKLDHNKEYDLIIINELI